MVGPTRCQPAGGGEGLELKSTRTTAPVAFVVVSRESRLNSASSCGIRFSLTPNSFAVELRCDSSPGDVPAVRTDDDAPCTVASNFREWFSTSDGTVCPGVTVVASSNRSVSFRTIPAVALHSASPFSPMTTAPKRSNGGTTTRIRPSEMLNGSWMGFPPASDHE